MSFGKSVVEPMSRPCRFWKNWSNGQIILKPLTGRIFCPPVQSTGMYFPLPNELIYVNFPNRASRWEMVGGLVSFFVRGTAVVLATLLLDHCDHLALGWLRNIIKEPTRTSNKPIDNPWIHHWPTTHWALMGGPCTPPSSGEKHRTAPTFEPFRVSVVVIALPLCQSSSNEARLASVSLPWLCR